MAEASKNVPGRHSSAQRGFSHRLSLRLAILSFLSADHPLLTAISSSGGQRTMLTAAFSGRADQNRYYFILFGSKSQA
jgi:hypothetical protein